MIRGDEVRHPLYGEGKVTEIVSTGRRVIVLFHGGTALVEAKELEVISDPTPRGEG